eukprot:664884-Pelagomonas_calceolata.AAC.1
MPPPQEDRLSSLPSDIHALIWAHLPSPDQQSLYNALPAFRSNAIHAQIKKLEISARGAGFFLLRRKMFERLCKFPTAADLQVSTSASRAAKLVPRAVQWCFPFPFLSTLPLSLVCMSAVV